MFIYVACLWMLSSFSFVCLHVYAYAFKSKGHCRSACEPGASRLPRPRPLTRMNKLRIRERMCTPCSDFVADMHQKHLWNVQTCMHWCSGHLFSAHHAHRNNAHTPSQAYKYTNISTQVRWYSNSLRHANRGSWGIFGDSSVTLAQCWRARDLTNLVICRSPVRFRPKTRELRFTWNWANRPSSKGSKLLFPVIKAN